METSVTTLDRLVSDVTAPALRSALADAISSAEGGLGVRAVHAVAAPGTGDAEDAVAVIGLLEAADRAEAAIHGLDGGVPSGAHASHLNGTAALSSGWLRARSAELANRIGPEAGSLQAATAIEQTEGRVLEAEDLYDAARPPARYLDAARLRTGSLLALAASLGAGSTGQAGEAEQLSAAARSLGVAAKIQQDISMFVSRFVAGAPASGPSPGMGLSHGVYPLPVIRAVEAEPKLASALGGPVRGEDLIELVGRIREAGGLARAADDCREHASAAQEGLAGVSHGEGLAAIAGEIAAAAKEAAFR